MEAEKTVSNQTIGTKSLGSLPTTPFPPQKRAIIDGLSVVDNGRVIKRLQYLREKYEIISPEEMHLIIDPTEVGATAEAQLARGAHRLEGWRNGLVLLPLMVTWLSLGLAGLAYAQSIGADPKLVAQPFLKQWADGFPGLSAITIGSVHIPLILNGVRLFTFGEIALFDFVVLGILVVLTLSIQRIELRARRKAAEISAWLEEEVYELSRESLVRSLGPGPGNKQPQWAVEVHTAISKLSNVLAEVKSVVVDFGTSIEKQRDTINKVIENTDRVATSVDRLDAIFQRGKETYDKLDAVMPKIERHFGNLATSQNQAVTDLKQISTDINKATNAITQIAQPFSEAGLAQVTHDAAVRMQRISEEQLRIYMAQQTGSGLRTETASPPKPRYGFWDPRRYFGE